ncbi:hypothetical protein [Clostridium fungisolvens]|nr:hypothetical protein [Clostridium fungisolvens]
MDKVRKRAGIGTCSPIMLVLALILSFSFGNNIVLGDLILDSFGLKAWSRGRVGVHYTLFYALAMVVIAYFIGDKYEEHLWAKAGKNSAIFVLALLTLIIIFDLVF